MTIADLTQSYAGKTDEELLRLAEQRGHLTVEAQSALASELAKRRIEISSIVPATSKESSVSSLQPGENAPHVHIKTGPFIEEVLRFYALHRWVFIRLVFPAMLVGFLAVMLTRGEAWRVFQHFRSSSLPRLPMLVRLEIAAICASGYLASWIAFCLAFAAVSDRTQQQGTRHGDFSGRIRQRAWPFLNLCMALLSIFLALEILIYLPVYLWGFRLLESYGRLGYFIWLVLPTGSYALIILILARFALAIPALILDGDSAANCLVSSYRLTQKKWAILAVLLFKGIVVSYVAAMLPFWLARWIPDSVTLPSWFHWLLSGASILCVTVVEPVMFIGFAMLYLKTTAHEPAEADAASA